MKTVILAAALMLGGAAVAQDTTTTTTTTTATTGGTTVAPGNTAPERDARGIAVISAEATAPPGYNQPAQTGPAGTVQPTPTVSSMGSAGQLPPCTKKVTDRCTQTYERGAR